MVSTKNLIMQLVQIIYDISMNLSEQTKEIIFFWASKI